MNLVCKHINHMSNYNNINYHKISTKIIVTLIISVLCHHSTNAEDMPKPPVKISKYPVSIRKYDHKSQHYNDHIPPVYPKQTPKNYTKKISNKKNQQSYPNQQKKQTSLSKNDHLAKTKSQIELTYPRPQLLCDIYKNHMLKGTYIPKKTSIMPKRKFEVKNETAYTTSTAKIRKKNPNIHKNIFSHSKINSNQIIKSIRNKNNNDSHSAINNTKKSEKYLWPVIGNTVDFFRNKNGIDIFVPSNTPIQAAKDGIVIYAGNDLVELGNMIIIRHDKSTATVYGHANVIYVKKGQRVIGGQKIGLSGTSGNTEQPEVYFEFRRNSIAMNPIDFLKQKPQMYDNQK
ncbi:MAG: hypothetical protein C4617_01750 [Candidatus Liberibacter europaeus]|uniref:M23ase beta-sheet core domain-containing protein n=1 Tax=Candidatus Liberibacter europaeus TaxID=744859 RepID=A0A2T4VXS7_9HYPH|nr:hypothetical protein [Candidatus Liberibacter europaeus]PTL86570.1 MAG: hypothetical protein C4617_01750 [Candidatus Liberibacter europaeus]